MPTFEITNPSDAYTIAHDDTLVACVATLLLGGGAYGLTREDGDRTMPILLLGGADKWLAERGIAPTSALEAWIDSHAAEIADALDSVMIGSFVERRRMERTLAAVSNENERRTARAAWHDERRSSLNDIGARAKKIAATMRARAEVA